MTNTQTREAGVPFGMYRNRRGKLCKVIGNTPRQKLMYRKLQHAA